MSHKLNVKLTELIPVDVLQKIQDSFASTVGMAALTTEADGTAVTEGSNFTDYCMKYTRCSEVGKSLCEECDRYGAEVTHKTGRFTTYICHSGLVDFSAPILADGQMVGCFIGGQVLYEPPEEENIRRIARELDINEDEYWAAIQKIPVIEKDQIDRAAGFLYTLSGVLSDMAYGEYKAMQANAELERAARMQADFLANMSHEIRTPMNAVIGFAEMALRENLPPEAENYIQQIKSSGNALLAIINDILDYSKIESGKMELIPIEYEPLSLIDDIANIIMTRLVDKDVELLIDVDPNIPLKVFGDNIRIRQILINLCNNATKFTNTGYVRLYTGCDRIDDKHVCLHFSVIDTGIGIKEQDMEKIFNSFQQVDSKRNRNIEGSGLGLSICRRLLKLMDSELHVESVYGEGSTFSFDLVQEIVDPSCSIAIEDADNVYLGAAFENSDVAADFVNDAGKLGVNCEVFYDYENREQYIADWFKKAKEGKKLYFFIDQQFFDPAMLEHTSHDLNITPVIIADTFADLRQLSEYKELMFLRKPISVLNLGNLFNKGTTQTHLEKHDQTETYSFTAEDARVLVVDDNIVNLTVAQGLLEPLKAKIDIASSGKEAIEMMNKADELYDIIFMDHMMPELDGIDTTRIIRRTMPDYADVPIIALTANALSDAKEMFMKEGMNDFVAKPIEVKLLVDAFRRYVPAEKICRVTHTDEQLVADENLASSQSRMESGENSGGLVIADLDTATALKMLGSEKLFMSILKTYYEAIDSRAAEIRRHYNSKNWPQYTIEVHALKSASRQIGAMQLGAAAASLEDAGKNLDTAYIIGNTDKLLEDYLAYKDKLSYLFEEKEDPAAADNKIEASMDILTDLFERMRTACDELDMDEMEAVISDMSELSYTGKWKEKYEALKNAVNSMDVDECIAVIDDWN